MEVKPKMSVEIAFNNLKSVCHGYRGTREEHDALQESLDTIKTELDRLAKLDQETFGSVSSG